MASKRITRVNELLKREIASYIYRLVNDPTDFDISALTVTKVETSSNLRHARVYVSIREHLLDRDVMLDYLREKRLAMQQHINQTMRLKYTPQLHFELDNSIEKGDRVLNLIAQLEQEYDVPSSENSDSEPEPHGG